MSRRRAAVLKVRAGEAGAFRQDARQSLQSRIEDYERRFQLLDSQIRILERERQKLSAVVNHAGAGFLVVDPRLKILWANDFAARQFRSAAHPSALLGLPCNRALCDRDAICETCPAARPFASGEVAHQEMRLAIGGATRHIYATGMPIRSPSGEIEEVILMLQDVSDLEVLRRSQEALLRSEQLLRQSQKMEAVGRLAGGVAHDFNNLLTVISGRCDLLTRRFPQSDPLHAEIATIQQAAHRAAALTGQLLAFSRKQVLQPRILDLNKVVADLERMLRSLIGEDIELTTVLRPGVGNVKADPGQIEQVILNLAVNARDAMPTGGKLVIETAEADLDETYAREHPPTIPGRYVMLALGDTGCGMDAETRARIFEPFFTTTEKGKGTGLGLATAYGIVKQSEGYIWVYSEPGLGSTFKIYLPRVEGAVGTEPQEAGAARTWDGTETVLLVEDEAVVRELVREILQRRGYLVLEARDVAEARRICEGHTEEIHLLLTDVVMPQMNGRELALALAPLRPGMRVLYISGYTDDSVVLRGIIEAKAAFLQKPFTPAALARKVREVLEAAAPAGRP
ncbi:MAG: response regulator [Acidobacteria bacterium]|nr:response regulator [Acidobacteriota bacterium]